MKVLVTSHGNFCHGLVESYGMIAGANDNIQAISLTDEGIGKFSEELNNTLEDMTSDDNVIIMTDIKGGTPYNESLKYMLSFSDKVRLISGMNLPMLIEVGLLLNANLNLDELISKAVDVGKDSIEVPEDELRIEDELDL